MTLPGILWIVGMLFVFVGEQVLGTGISRWTVDGIGLLLVLGGIGLRARGLSTPDPSVRQAGLFGLGFAALSASALLLHALGSDEVTALLGFSDDGIVRWQGVFGVLTPVVLLVGALPMFFLDLVLSGNPVVLPRDAARRAMISGLFASLAISLAFPVNYLATQLDDVELDTSYFRTAKPGPATRAMLQGLTEPLDVYLFFPSGNEVLEEIRGYTRDAEAAAPAGLLNVEVHDQATSIGLAEELKLQDNGWVVFRRAATEEGGSPTVVKFKMREEMNRAKRDLRRFDSLFQKNLLKATRGTRTAYFVTGHDEASQRVRDNDWRKLSKLRKDLKEQSYKLDDVGLAEGLAEKVPEDAEVLILASPMQPLLPEEVASITTWLEQGGELLVMVDSQSDELDELLGWLGLEVTPGPIADPKRRLRGQSPYLVVADRYGTHPSVSALSKRRQPLLLPGPVALTETDGGNGKQTVLVRTYGTAFSDVNKNGRMDEQESTRVLNLAYAVEGGDGENAWRAVVIGNQGFVSDQAYTYGWRMGGDLVVDALRWLEGEEELVGETESEEDVKIDHSPEGQAWYFWGTIFAVPLLVLGAALTRFLIRRRMA